MRTQVQLLGDGTQAQAAQRQVDDRRPPHQPEGCALRTDQATDLGVLVTGEFPNLQDHAAPPPRRLHELCPDLRNDALSGPSAKWPGEG